MIEGSACEDLHHSLLACTTRQLRFGQKRCDRVFRPSSPIQAKGS